MIIKVNWSLSTITWPNIVRSWAIDSILYIFSSLNFFFGKEWRKGVMVVLCLFASQLFGCSVDVTGDFFHVWSNSCLLRWWIEGINTPILINIHYWCIVVYCAFSYMGRSRSLYDKCVLLIVSLTSTEYRLCLRRFFSSHRFFFNLLAFMLIFFSVVICFIECVFCVSFSRVFNINDSRALRFDRIQW